MSIGCVRNSTTPRCVISTRPSSNKYTRRGSVRFGTPGPQRCSDAGRLASKLRRCTPPIPTCLVFVQCVQVVHTSGVSEFINIDELEIYAEETNILAIDGPSAPLVQQSRFSWRDRLRPLCPANLLISGDLYFFQMSNHSSTVSGFPTTPFSNTVHVMPRVATAFGGETNLRKEKSRYI
jgi:hypothetical protein